MEEFERKKVSVIVPVYNTEAYLERCVRSILNQTYRNLEIILVDDGSKDQSGAICDELANTDSRIFVIHQKNAGQSAARNCGMKAATGFYLAFVDSDDYIAPQMYEKMVDYLERNQLGLVMCARMSVCGGNSSSFYYYEKDCIVSCEEARKCILTDTWGSQPCDKLFVRSIWGNLTFPEGRIYEDLAIIYQYFYQNTKRCGYIHEPLYYYVMRENSTSFRKNGKQIFGLFTAFYDRYRFACQYESDCEDICLVKAGNSALGVMNTFFSQIMQDQMETIDLAGLFLSEEKHKLLASKKISLKRKVMFLAYYYMNPLYKLFFKLRGRVGRD